MTLHVIKKLRILNNVMSHVRTSCGNRSETFRYKSLTQYRRFTAGVTGGVKQIHKHDGKQQDHHEDVITQEEEAPRILITGTIQVHVHF